MPDGLLAPCRHLQGHEDPEVSGLQHEPEAPLCLDLPDLDPKTGLLEEDLTTMLRNRRKHERSQEAAQRALYQGGELEALHHSVPQFTG